MQILFKGSSQSKKYPKKLEKAIIFCLPPLHRRKMKTFLFLEKYFFILLNSKFFAAQVLIIYNFRLLCLPCPQVELYLQISFWAKLFLCGGSSRKPTHVKKKNWFQVDSTWEVSPQTTWSVLEVLVWVLSIPGKNYNVNRLCQDAPTPATRVGGNFEDSNLLENNI